MWDNDTGDETSKQWMYSIYSHYQQLKVIAKNKQNKTYPMMSVTKAHSKTSISVTVISKGEGPSSKECVATQRRR
jgi:hypothetical protein